MKKEHLEYLEKIGIKPPIRDRIEQIYEFYSEICPEEIEVVFVSDYNKEDGSRIYEQCRFYSKHFVMVADNFLQADDFSFFNSSSLRIFGIRIEKKHYDFKKANDKSRMILVVEFEDNIMAHIKATKENCDYLKVLMQKRYMPSVCSLASQKT